MSLQLEFHPLTMKHWKDFVSLFGPRGACGGCWCMFWRLSGKEFEARKGEGNKKAMRTLVNSGEVPGILAFHQGRAVGWCALAPRGSYPTLSRSRILKPVDERPCWSVSCFFIDKAYRRKGVSTRLLEAAVAYARSRGARLVEGYPVEPRPGKEAVPVFAYTGLSRAFIRAGFKEVARRSPTRPIMRIELD
ncbi:MAG: GNAT family N-acetyltransferase [Candidatus Krumholzibacteriota bacterium]|nr:GNAT family N-acetyltransferase [Candidatus Krumholzibacteriota bacterium]